jgi:hypothetical protein
LSCRYKSRMYYNIMEQIKFSCNGYIFLSLLSNGHSVNWTKCHSCVQLPHNEEGDLRDKAQIILHINIWWRQIINFTPPRTLTCP